MDGRPKWGSARARGSTRSSRRTATRPCQASYPKRAGDDSLHKLVRFEEGKVYVLRTFGQEPVTLTISPSC